VSQDSSLDVAFLFLDAEDHNLYQLRQWLQPLERLSKHKSVKVIYSSNDVKQALKSSSVAGIQFDGQDELEEILYQLYPKTILYPNQNVRNFYALRFPRAIHVFVSHGESDKAYMSQNTIKRYDMYFAAGDAAKERIRSKVQHFDVDSRILEIGRPQSLDVFEKPKDFVVSDKRRILYAPTWEGVTRATRYSSIASHGQELVQRLLETGLYQITYRPHPLSGSRDQEIKKANKQIKDLLASANRKDPSASHYIDKSTFGWQLDYHDLMISDISAIAYDWLSTGNPILLTKPTEKKAVVEDFPLTDKLHSIDISELANISSLVASQFEEGSNHRDVSKELNARYFRGPKEQSDQFLLDAINHAEQLRSDELADKDFPRLEGYVSRGGALGLLRYPNFAVRETLRLAGLWSTAKELAKAQKTDQIFVHLTDPFNAKSLIPSLTKLLQESDPAKQLVLVTNQVTNLLAVRRLIKRSFPAFDGKLLVIPVVNAADCEVVVQKLLPKKALYLKHHPLNHMLLRLNGLSHTLWKPDLDPFFAVDHSVITYDFVVAPKPETANYLAKLLRVSRPEVINS